MFMKSARWYDSVAHALNSRGKRYRLISDGASCPNPNIKSQDATTSTRTKSPTTLNTSLLLNFEIDSFSFYFPFNDIHRPNRAVFFLPFRQHENFFLHSLFFFVIVNSTAADWRSYCIWIMCIFAIFPNFFINQCFVHLCRIFNFS